MKITPSNLLQVTLVCLVLFLNFSCNKDSDLLAEYVVNSENEISEIPKEVSIDLAHAVFTTEEDQPVTFNLLYNTSSERKGRRRYKSSSKPKYGAITIEKDSIAVYTPPSDYNGKDDIEITLEVTNEDETTSEEVVTIDVTVEPVTDVVEDIVEVTSEEPVIIEPLKNDTFKEESEVVITEVSQPSNGTAVINEDNTITYTPNTNNTEEVTTEEVVAEQVVADEEDTFTYTTSVTNPDNSVTEETGSVTVTNKTPTSEEPVEMGGLKAFPGAEGFGQYATGGRGGKVIHVTNLNDSGSGSFREALEASGTRTIVFDVGGTINAKNYFDIPYGKGNVTIAGQTAPGGGILIRGGELRISASNVIVRYIRFRLGSSTAGAASNEDGINITAYSGNKIENIIIDHCSVSWAQDENISLVGGFSGSTVSNVTIQNCIIAESGYGLLSYKNNRNISVINNLFANNKERNIRANWPISGAFQFEQINNIVYGYRGGNNPSLGIKFTSLNNIFKKAPSISFGGNASVQGEEDGTGNPGDTYAYITGNIAASGQSEYSSNLKPYLKSAPFDSSGYSAIPASALEDKLLDHVGASLPTRDAVDSRIINNYKSGLGSLVNSGTFPNISGGNAQNDSDKDGISDTWEKANGLNPNDAGDNNKETDASGYTNLEVYLHALTIK